MSDSMDVHEEINNFTNIKQNKDTNYGKLQILKVTEQNFCWATCKMRSKAWAITGIIPVQKAS